jgi:hypothetical protein
MSAATKLIRGVAIYDIVATAGLAVPGLSALTLGLFRQLHVSLGLAGDFPEFAPMHHMFVNCVGIVVIAFSLIRIRTPVRFPTLCDSGARLAVAATILFHTYVGGMSPVFLVFVFSELVGLLINLWALRDVRD